MSKAPVSVGTSARFGRKSWAVLLLPVPAFPFPTKKGLSVCLPACHVTVNLPLLPFLFLLPTPPFKFRNSNARAQVFSMNPGLIHRSIASSISSSIDVNLHSKSNRRKTLKTLFRIPLDATKSSSNDVDVDTTNTSGVLAGSSLPHDIIREIVGLLSPADILNFSLTVCLLLSILPLTIHMISV